MFQQIPLQRPKTPLLDSVDVPAKLRLLDEEQLPALARELREFMLYSVGQTGGHFGAGLGVVELTIALHYVYNTPDDRLVWDVGHQAYPHKILTGRREQMLTMRQKDGLSGFPKRSESPYDSFGVGHSSTSISAALGMALAAKLNGSSRKTVAVIGDGAMTAGMAFEALNHAAHTAADMLVVLNDNNMSISHNVGGLATYFSKIWASKPYNSLRSGGKKMLAKIPPAWELARKTEEHMKGMVSPGTLFEELGFNYIGPLDGHDLQGLVHTISNLKDLEGPQLLHICTQKGKGFEPAENDPVGYHALNKLEAKTAGSLNAVKESPAAKPPVTMKFQDVFGQWLCDMASVDSRLVGITPAMSEGSGMTRFSRQFPDRYHDVAIAEQHAVTLAAGLACEGIKPVVAIYSTFLQRAYDQLIHDVALQELDVLFAIDRAGVVGEDGATHAGNFDLSFLRCIPNMIIMTPSDENETRQMLYTGFIHKGPAAVRYPRGLGIGAHIQQDMIKLDIGKGVIRRQGKGAAILCFGPLLHEAAKIAEELDITLVDMRFLKPLDSALVLSMARQHELLVTLEENVIMAGAGSAVNEILAAANLQTPVLNLGLPDHFPAHGKASEILEDAGLDANSIKQSVISRLSLIRQSAIDAHHQGHRA
ncbi:MAG: 1-deoxy-D-xylulose-5-phosphate synthase [Pseudomonadales bacterium]|nr:1-deoxy-D-xylulose-5-phosphate synthase [Pseudomonadales bacterium]